MSPSSRLLACTALGTLAIVAYDYLFVPKMNQGHWYFPVPNLLASLVVVEGTRRLLHRPKGRAGRAVRALVAVAGAVASLWIYMEWRPADSDVGYGAFYFDEAPLVRAHYAGKPVKMVEFDDGIVTFATGIPALSGTGLTVDAEAVPLAGKGKNAGFGQSGLLDLGISRGFNRFTTLVYQHERIRPTANDREIRRAYAFLVGRNASGCTLAVDYYSPKSGFTVVRADCPAGAPRH
jgi:hypothetical protein